MTRKLVLTAVLCLCAIVAVKPVSGADDAKAKELKALDAEWSKAAVAKNVDKIVSYYAEDAVAYPPNEPAVRGHDKLRQTWADMVNMPGSQISWKTVTASVDGNLGYTAGTYQDSAKGKDGKTVSETGKYLCVWRKGSDGKWKAIHDMWNSDSK